MATKRTRVLVIDDSALMRQLLTQIIQSDPTMEVVGAAPDPYVAWEKIQLLRPDVLTLDVEMPRMDGVTFLERLMRLHPMPVVMVSTLTEKGCETTLSALELGAVDYVTKPKLNVRDGTAQLSGELLSKLRAAAQARVRRRAPRPKGEAVKKAPRVAPLERIHSLTHKVLAIGASTGGTEAVREVVSRLPVNAPPTVMVLHMPPRYTRSYAQRLDQACHVDVREARDGDALRPGLVLLSPGSHHMEVKRSGASYSVRLLDTPPVNHHRPAVDVLFRSVAKELGKNAVGVILTGMGQDGAHGLAEMKKAGAGTVAQDEETSVVFGMPREAIALGCVDVVAPIQEVAESALKLMRAL